MKKLKIGKKKMNNYKKINIKHNNRYVSTRIPNYIFLDYVKHTMKLNDKYIEREIVESIQNLYNLHLNDFNEKITFSYFIIKLMYQDIMIEKNIIRVNKEPKKIAVYEKSPEFIKMKKNNLKLVRENDKLKIAEELLQKYKWKYGIL